MNDWSKYLLLKIALFASFGLIFVTVLKYGLIQHHFFKDLASNNRIISKIIPSPRGKIIDRKEREVVKSIYQYYKLEDKNKIFDTKGDFNGYKFEGRDLAYDIYRQYFYDESMGVITGYLGRVSESEITNKKCGLALDADEETGRGGIEEYLDCQLRGKDGKRLIEVDALGNYIRELGREEPEIGENIQLSIDAYFQKKIYEMIKDKRAVVIISNPKNGEVLSLVSSPSINPNYFSNERDENIIKSYLNDNENLPMLNRAISGRYHPGSVFKIILATAGLETGVIDNKTIIEDTGVIKIGEYSYNNWYWTQYGKTEGAVDIYKALQRSNDIYFYKLGEKLGVNRIKEWADKFGYNKKTGIELVGEVEGIIPNEEWKKRVKGENWFLGNTYHMAIGQGDVSVTPLQVNQMTNVIANGGKKCDMTIIKGKKTNCVDIKIKKETLEIIKEGMKRACKSGGTAYPLFNSTIEIACKTGTAEVGDGTKDNHAWLTAFAPANDPEISITVMVERGGEGSQVAAPIVADVLKEWFGEN